MKIKNALVSKTVVVSLLVFGAACARKPGKQIEQGALDSAFKKADFVGSGKTFVVGKSTGAPGDFITFVRSQEKPLSFNLVANNDKVLSDGDVVEFKLFNDADKIKLYFAGNGGPCW